MDPILLLLLVMVVLAFSGGFLGGPDYPYRSGAWGLSSLLALLVLGIWLATLVS